MVITDKLWLKIIFPTISNTYNFSLVVVKIIELLRLI